MRILIAEDDADSRDMLATMLENAGHQVVCAENGRQAWEIFEKDSISVVISDWLMPELSGLELCARIRSADRPKYSYVILITALRGKNEYLRAMGAGADDFVSKPYDPDELVARLMVADRIMKLQDRVKRLEGVLPTCMYCKKIRDREKGTEVWTGIEDYIAQRTAASFSHGVCPDCYEQVVKPELSRLRNT